MNQLTTFVLVITGLTTLFFVMGVDSNQNALLTLILNPQDMQTSVFFGSIGVAILSTGAAFYFGFIAKNAELAVMSIVTPIVANSLWHIGSIIIKVSDFNPIFELLVLSPIAYLLVLTFNEYFRGRD